MISRGCIVFGLSLLAPSCGGATPRAGSRREPARSTATPQPEEIWASCSAGFKPTGQPKTDLDRLTRACGPTGGMRAITPVTIAHQREHDAADRYTFYVPTAGACYRVFATGDRNVRDLDLLLHGPDGEDLSGDLTHDAYPVLPPSGPLCFDTPGLYMLEVSVFRGAGRYALQIWGNPAGIARAPKH